MGAPLLFTRFYCALYRLLDPKDIYIYDWTSSSAVGLRALQK